MTVGENIRALRKKRGLTQDGLGALCGMSGVAVCAYERGKTLPKRKAIERFARALNVPPSKITGETALPPPGPQRLLFDGILGALKERYGAVEGRILVGGSGGHAKYYAVGQGAGRFVLHESDVSALACSAEACLLSMAEQFRRQQGSPLAWKKLG